MERSRGRGSGIISSASASTSNAAFAQKERNPNEPQLPPRSRVAHGGYADPGGEGIDIELDDLVTEWRLMADLFAMAVELDRVRFGSLTFLAAGERLRIKGAYEYGGRKVFDFDDGGQRNASRLKGLQPRMVARLRPGGEEHATASARAHEDA